MDEKKKGEYLLSKGWETIKDVPGYYIHPKNIDGLRFGYRLEDAYIKQSIESIRPSFIIMNNIVEWVDKKGKE